MISRILSKGSLLVPLTPVIEETARTPSPMMDDESRSARRVHSLAFKGADCSALVERSSCDFALHTAEDMVGDGCDWRVKC